MCDFNTLQIYCTVRQKRLLLCLGHRNPEYFPAKISKDSFPSLQVTADLYRIIDPWNTLHFKMSKVSTNLSTTPNSLVLRKEYFDCTQRDSHQCVTFKRGGIVESVLLYSAVSQLEPQCVQRQNPRRSGLYLYSPTLWVGQVRWGIGRKGLTLSFPLAGEYDLINFTVLYLKILFRRLKLDFCTPNIVYHENLINFFYQSKRQNTV